MPLTYRLSYHSHPERNHLKQTSPCRGIMYVEGGRKHTRMTNHMGHLFHIIPFFTIQH